MFPKTSRLISFPARSVLKAGTDKEAHFDSLNKVAAGDLSAMGQVTHDYGTGNYRQRILSHN